MDTFFKPRHVPLAEVCLYEVRDGLVPRNRSRRCFVPYVACLRMSTYGVEVPETQHNSKSGGLLLPHLRC